MRHIRWLLFPFREGEADVCRLNLPDEGTQPVERAEKCVHEFGVFATNPPPPQKNTGCQAWRATCQSEHNKAEAGDVFASSNSPPSLFWPQLNILQGEGGLLQKRYNFTMMDSKKWHNWMFHYTESLIIMDRTFMVIVVNRCRRWIQYRKWWKQTSPCKTAGRQMFSSNVQGDRLYTRLSGLNINFSVKAFATTWDMMG